MYGYAHHNSCTCWRYRSGWLLYVYSLPLFRTAEKGCLRARIHYPALKCQQLAILTCAHGCVFSMHIYVSGNRIFILLTMLKD